MFRGEGEPDLHYFAVKERKGTLRWPFFWLTAFYFVYCARTQDYIPGLASIPMAKITGLLAMLGLVMSAGKTERKLHKLPIEAKYLFLLIAVLFTSAFVSPVSRADAFFNALEFSKVYIAWILTYLLVTTLPRLRRVIFIQSASVATVSIAALVKGHSVPRLAGVIGGFYSNPNDLAFGIVLCLPFCLAFLFTTKRVFSRIAWSLGIAMMVVALLLTASRAGFIALVISGAFCLWYFGVKQKRRWFIAAYIIAGALVLLLAGGLLIQRFSSISTGEGTAYGSYVERQLLISRALDAIVNYPILGVGAQNFTAYSGIWRNVHLSYLQIAAEAGIPGLILYLLFFWRGFVNLSRLRGLKNLDAQMQIFVGASQASLIGFVVGASFAPEAYQFFPYFAVCYTSVMIAMAEEKRGVEIAGEPARVAAPRMRYADFFLNRGNRVLLTRPADGAALRRPDRSFRRFE